MENKEEMQSHDHSCKNMCCQMYGGHRILRWLLGIIVLFFVFCAGVAIGSHHSQYGHMRYGGFRDGGNMMYFNTQTRALPVDGSGPGMMNTFWVSGQAQVATSTPVKK